MSGYIQFGFRVHVPDDEVLGIGLIIVIMQFWGRLMIMMYLDTVG